MDALERLSGVGGDLLRHVDAALAEDGAPADDPIWPLLRRVGALPGDALDFALRLDAPALRIAAEELRAIADRFAHERDRLAADVGRSAWEGTGAEAFAAVWRSLSDHIGPGPDPATICGRLLATVSYVDGLAGWAVHLREEMAEAVARAVSSAEAVTLRAAAGAAFAGGGLAGGGLAGGGFAGGGFAVGAGFASGVPGGGLAGAGRPPATAVVEAAARIGARILRPAADAVTAAAALRSRWSPELAELVYAAPEVASPSSSTVTRVEL
ncbi:hypothetical protein Drose_02770 [Dactylosporangium roseum]|uniref:PPE family domain-containing protein n=1 Tax=Dactylosporangium roseum TaxID=47989 RepID=A0ABY5Z8T7_9ACTN|nr:WXG100 family type VII secretion target [Dactylosporangium roseum]UWZ37242.1 hypothetical protein Drose_02770 [Dactylosporangium roseum]